MDNLKKIDGNWWLCYMRRKANIPCNLMLLDIPVQILKRYKKVSGDNRLFPMPTEATTNRQLKQVVKQAGILKDATWNMARHTFASEICLANGVPIETISRMLGHTNVKTTQIYARVSDTIIEKEMNGLAQKLNQYNFTKIHK